jgi:hypothetical protein
MMAMAEITVTQMQIMRDVAMNMNTFIMGKPNEGDPAGLRADLEITVRETEGLVALGFIEDITSLSQDRMTALDAISGRKHRLYTITEMGRAFFREAASQEVN